MNARWTKDPKRCQSVEILCIQNSHVRDSTCWHTFDSLCSLLSSLILIYKQHFVYLVFFFFLRLVRPAAYGKPTKGSGHDSPLFPMKRMNKRVCVLTHHGIPEGLTSSIIVCILAAAFAAPLNVEPRFASGPQKKTADGGGNKGCWSADVAVGREK
jgi:hypothetical protein